MRERGGGFSRTMISPVQPVQRHDFTVTYEIIRHTVYYIPQKQPSSQQVRRQLPMRLPTFLSEGVSLAARSARAASLSPANEQITPKQQQRRRE